MTKLGRPKVYTAKFLKKEAQELMMYIDKTLIPFKNEFCLERNYSPQRISEFAKINTLFSEALKRLEAKQELNIVKGALSNKLNASFAIFTLKNVAGWRDVQEHKGSVSIKVTDERKKEIASILTQRREIAGHRDNGAGSD